MRSPSLAFLLALVLSAGVAVAQESKPQSQPPAQEQPPAEPAFVVPPEEAQRQNPVKPDEISLAQGKRLYETQCALCHGVDGRGKTELATAMQLTLRDYSDPKALKDFTDGELFYILRKGKGKMPGQEGRMRERQMWHLVNYIRSLAKKVDND
ncbi:MAG: c-type cytochrome [Firmicutes bacterium]|nr:c-type cytochrome [Bacillota bacterium]